VIAIIAVERRDKWMFPNSLETSWSELEKEVAVDFLECPLLTAISFAWQAEVMIAERLVKGSRWYIEGPEVASTSIETGVIQEGDEW